MNPDMMNSMMGMLNNPETMSKMNEMMKNPQIQEMLNNPEMMNNMMSMFGIPDMRNNQENVSEDLVSDLKQKYDKIENAENQINQLENKFNSEDIVILHGLKNEKFNEKRCIVHSYNSEKSRYVVLVDEDDVKIMVKEENMRLESEPVVEENNEETVIQVD